MATGSTRGGGGGQSNRPTAAQIRRIARTIRRSGAPAILDAPF